MKKIICVILAFSLVSVIFCGCKAEKAEPVDKDDFRVTAYLVCSKIEGEDDIDLSNLPLLTDIILFGIADFDEKGNIIKADNFDKSVELIRSLLNDKQRLHINLLGPKAEIDSDDWNEQMDDLAQRNTNAFISGSLEDNIKALLDEYDFDGVFFDYEYPLSKKYWKPFNSFIVSLDNTLGDNYLIGMALSDWCAKQSRQAREATDMVELMSYDNWDENGYHSTYELAEKSINKLIKKGYKPSQLDLGVPFYARPTTQDAYWYSYKDYYDKLSSDGLYNDSETGLTFSFNNTDVIKKKTLLAIEYGLGGMMVWNYSCDLPYENDESLFKAINDSKNSAYENSEKN